MLLTDGGGCFSKTMPGPHTARETTYFLSQNNINVFTSPSKSPFCISLAWIESNFVFRPMVSFVIHIATLD
jgi:hypothetical protein